VKPGNIDAPITIGSEPFFTLGVTRNTDRHYHELDPSGRYEHDRISQGRDHLERATSDMRCYCEKLQTRDEHRIIPIGVERDPDPGEADEEITRREEHVHGLKLEATSPDSLVNELRKFEEYDPCTNSRSLRSGTEDQRGCKDRVRQDILK